MSCVGKFKKRRSNGSKYLKATMSKKAQSKGESCPFGQFTSTLPCLFPFSEEVCAIDYDVAENERERQRDRERERQRELRDRQRGKERDRETETEKERERETERDLEVEETESESSNCIGKFAVWDSLYYGVAFQTTLTVVRLPQSVNSNPKSSNRSGHSSDGEEHLEGFEADEDREGEGEGEGGDCVLAEIDFQHDLSALAWDSRGQCLVVSDVTGCIHIVKADGSVLFQKKVFPGNEVFFILQLSMLM